MILTQLLDRPVLHVSSAVVVIDFNCVGIHVCISTWVYTKIDCRISNTNQQKPQKYTAGEVLEQYNQKKNLKNI